MQTAGSSANCSAEMGATGGAQWYQFLLCGGMGFWLGALYELFHLVRWWCRPSKGAVFGMDVAYCLVSAVGIFLFLLATAGGQGQLSAVLGLPAGFFAFRFSVGKALFALARFTRRRMAKFAKLFLKKDLKPDSTI